MEGHDGSPRWTSIATPSGRRHTARAHRSGVHQHSTDEVSFLSNSAPRAGTFSAWPVGVGVGKDGRILGGSCRDPERDACRQGACGQGASRRLREGRLQGKRLARETPSGSAKAFGKNPFGKKAYGDVERPASENASSGRESEAGLRPCVAVRRDCATCDCTMCGPVPRRQAARDGQHAPKTTRRKTRPGNGDGLFHNTMKIHLSRYW